MTWGTSGVDRAKAAWPPSAAVSAGLVALALAVAIGGAFLYGSLAASPPSVGRDGPARHGWVVELELGGSPAAARRALGFPSRPAAQDLDSAVRAARSALETDYLLIASYVAALATAGALGAAVFVSGPRRGLARKVVWAAGVAGALDVLENVWLDRGLSALEPAGDAGTGWFEAAALAASFKFGLLAVAIPVAFVAAYSILKRAVASKRRTRPVGLRGKVYIPSPILGSRGGRWPATSSGVVAPPEGEAATLPPGAEHHRYGRMVPASRKPARSGFCVSGGGIRSACVTLGALQALRGRLLGARYLVSVSGGGYMAGAMLLALMPRNGERVRPSTPEDVFAAGSVEEGHTRRHGNYIADGAKEWSLALVAVLRGLVGSLAILVSTILTVGLAFSFVYEAVPLFGGPGGLEALTRYFTGDRAGVPPFPAPTGYSGWAVAGGALATLVFWMTGIVLIDAASFKRTRRWVFDLARATASATAVLGVFVLVVPAVAWGSARVASIGVANTGGRALGGSLLTFIATYFGALTSILWRQRKKVAEVQKEVKGWFGKKRADTAGMQPRGFVQRVIVWVVLALLLVFALAAFGATVATGSRWGRWAVLPPAILLFVQAGVDQTWMSLHPFYRRRLATAFAVRRRELPDSDVAAQPYAFDGEPTWLEEYGKDHEPFPQVVFACAANLSGSDRTPPGRRAVSYTLSHDYVGGPDVGYAPTEDVRACLSGPLKTDLTVQAAMAVSGAAFASAMGRQAKAFQTLLAISNARLGTWLPNPVYLDQLSAEAAPWWLPNLPRIRRLTYFLREVVGYFPQDDRLLLVTDGGHYENLGLVELLRHQVRVAYCIDASGDNPPFPQTLCEAITLAKEELGIDIDLDMLDLLPGSADAIGGDALKSLSARLSKTCVAIGRIRYPEPFCAPGETTPSAEGVLVFAKALLTRDMPPDLLAYAQAEPVFPRDGTGDQWFSHEQFDAYVELGRCVGKVVLSRTAGAL